MGALEPASWGARILHLVLPPACAGCGDYLPTAGPDGVRRKVSRICIGCRMRLKEPGHPRCTRCDAPRGTGLAPDRVCVECHAWPPILESARSAYILAPPADSLVHALKYGGWPEVAEDLAERMVRAFRSESALFKGGTPIVPVPTTPRREKSRGYNQARVLASAFVALAGGTVVDALARREEATSQVALLARDRLANVRGAFALNEAAAASIRDRDVILMDDVLTTGATASAAAETLGGGGVRSVRLFAFARALPG